ncbi:hypothetical protein, partial [Sutterella wadsworthensis]|uniref:hypothetical protein n=1 Tax=Sutterella wadsworthensis TaxID=40545 RepID=UPI003FF06034
ISFSAEKEVYLNFFFLSRQVLNFLPFIVCYDMFSTPFSEQEANYAEFTLVCQVSRKIVLDFYSPHP